MPAYFSTYISKKILDSLFVDGVALPTYSTLNCAIFHNSTGTTETNLRANTLINEITDTNYSRVPLTITAGASFNAATSPPPAMLIDNKNEIDFPGAAAAYPNPVSHVALLDASDNVIMFSSITPQAIGISQYIQIPVASFSITL